MCREMGRANVWKNYHVVARPVDKRENFIKRCVGISGDKLQVIDQKVYINGKELPSAPGAEFFFKIKTKGLTLNKKTFEKYDITEPTSSNPNRPFEHDYNFNDSTYLLMITTDVAEKLKSLPYVSSVTRINFPWYLYYPTKELFESKLFPFDSTYKWEVDNYGPVNIPKVGETVTLTSKNIALYRRIIGIYEGNKLLEKDGKIFINSKETTSYTFKMNYYWMMGDNRHNSMDSRYWGFVPEDHIVGKAVFVWLSLDPNKSLFEGKIRWSKMFRLIH